MKGLIFLVSLFYIGMDHLFAGGQAYLFLGDNPNDESSKPITIKNVYCNSDLEKEIKIDGQAYNEQELTGIEVFPCQNLTIIILNNNNIKSQGINNPLVRLGFEVEGQPHHVCLGSIGGTNGNLTVHDFQSTRFKLKIENQEL